MKRYIKLENIIPEAIALSVFFATEMRGLTHACFLYLTYSIILRSAWNSAIIVHGLGHSIAIAFADKQLSVLNLNNILEHRSVASILKSLVPFQPIFIHNLLVSPPPYLIVEKPQGIKIKALGGIVLNLLVAIAIYSFSNSLGRVLIAANLLIAFFSTSDLKAFITGVADYLYCGNFGLIALRQPDDGQQLLPERMLDIALQMGQETEIRGEQAGGGFIIGSRGNNTMFAERKVVFVGKKIVNRKRANLTESLSTAFKFVRARAIAAGVKPLESTVTGVWHYRYATSGTAPSELETHWHEWMEAREREVWEFKDGEWVGVIKNVHHRITHNGDFDSWQIFNRWVDNATLGMWLERVLHTPNATKGDSPKIAGIMDLLVTQGMWYESVRLAYQLAIATSIEDAFNRQKPALNAPNTAPSDKPNGIATQRDLNSWAEIFEYCFIQELSRLKSIDLSLILPESLKFSRNLQHNLVEAFRSHPATEHWSQLQTVSFIQNTFKAFFDNDLYRATQIFISHAQGSFGLVTASTLEESELVLCAKGQPISVGFNWLQGYMVYASEPAAIERVLSNKSQCFRLDLDQRGEVAKVSANKISVYSLTQQQQVRSLQLKNRWISMHDRPYSSYMQFSATEELDPVANDINSIPRVLHEIKTDWEDSTSLNRRSADYLIYLLIEKVQQFENKQRMMFKAGLISKIRKMSTVDLLITGEENSLWLGEKFAEDLKVVFPFLNVVAISANQILQQLERGFAELNLGKDSLVLAITQSGQTFSTVQIINVFDHLSSQGVIGELFIITGELSSFVDSVQGRGGLTKITNSSFIDNHRCRIFVNGSGRRIAEPSTVAVAAAKQTLTELLFYLAQQMSNNIYHTNPFGMTLSSESLMVLAMMKEDFLYNNLVKIVGTNAEGELIKSTTNQELVRDGGYWANHVIETPLAWAIHALYIFISVGWVIPFGYTLPLVKTLSGLLFNLLNIPSFTQFLSPLITFADIGVYIFGAWLWTLAIRFCQGRQLLARMGKRTLVIGDVTWVNQLLQAYISKLFALSYGIATMEVHSANPQNHLLHAFAHRIVRGTLIWLGIPDGRGGKQQQQAENAVIMTGKQINGVRNLKVGAEIIALSSNRAIARLNFCKALILDSNNNSIYFRLTTAEQKEQIEKLRESCFGSFERLLAGYVFFWALAKKVASFPFLKYEHWKSQSRTKVMTTASPVAGFDLDRLTDENRLEELHTNKTDQPRLSLFFSLTN